MAARLEADGVDGAVHLRDAEDLLDLVLGIALGDVDRLAAERACLLEPLRNQVADDHDGGAQELRGVGRGEPDRPGTGDVDGRARGHARAARTPW